MRKVVDRYNGYTVMKARKNCENLYLVYQDGKDTPEAEYAYLSSARKHIGKEV